MAPLESPKMHWLRHTRSVLDLVSDQVRSLRQRQIVGAFTLRPRTGPAWRDGTYRGIRTDIANHALPDPLPCPHDATIRLADVATRLAKIDERLQER